MRALTPTRLTNHWYAFNASYACAPWLTNKRLTRLFLSCVVVSIIRYGLRLKNPRKATVPDFIPLKVIKFDSNVIDSHLYNNIIKDLKKNKYSKGSKTALVRPIFKKNKRNKIKNYNDWNIKNLWRIVYSSQTFFLCWNNNIKFHISL